MLYPLVVLVVGIVTVLGLMIVLRANAFLALMAAAMVVSLLSPGPLSSKIERAAVAFGTTAGKIGVVIALAAIVGKCLMDSGAADRIVRSLLRLLGQGRAPTVLVASGFILAMPVFFDTVFYLLVPLARSLWRQTRKDYMLYILAIGCGGAITHTLVPPTPGPLAVASNLSVDLGLTILVGTLIGIPTAVVGLAACRLLARRLDVPMRPYPGEQEPAPLADSALPPLWLSLLPVVLPVVLISLNTVAGVSVDPAYRTLIQQDKAIDWPGMLAVLGDPNLALFLSAVIAMATLLWKRRIGLLALAEVTETALMSAGVIILITAAGGAFGSMLREAGIKDAVEQMLTGLGGTTGMLLLVVGFLVAAVLKIAQGSSTVAMLTTSSMLAAMFASPQAMAAQMHCHPVYLGCAIAGGSLVGSWMNDSGFWVVARMSMLTELETLRSWTVLLVIIGTTILVFSLLGAWLFPLI